VPHCDDLPLKLQKVLKSDVGVPGFLNGIISIHERETFRDKLLLE
jgi:hypothetical protein